jgi:hypothetical protein
MRNGTFRFVAHPVLITLEEIIAVYCKDHMKQTSTLYGENAELLIIKADGTYKYH